MGGKKSLVGVTFVHETEGTWVVWKDDGKDCVLMPAGERPHMERSRSIQKAVLRSEYGWQQKT